jgi:15-cis-phytoene desaturase
MWSNNAPTWRALKFGEEDVAELDRVAALEYLRAAGVSERMIDWFWRFAAMVVMNVPLERCSTGALLRVHAQLIGRRGIHFGFAAAGLSEFYVPQAERLIRAAGGEVLCNAEVVRLEPQAVHLGDGRRIATRFCVLAVPPQDLARFAPGLADTAAFAPSPYVSTYLWLDRKIAAERFWALPWARERLNYDFYDLTGIRPGWDARPTVIATNAIYALRAAGMDDDAIVRATLAELALFAPQAAQARVVHADVHRIPMGICQPQPGTEAKRPPTRTSVPRVFLAGDWTRTALPSSMESAVRSGFLAAEALLADLGRARRFAHGVRPRDGFAALVRAATVAARALGPVLARARA